MTDTIDTKTTDTYPRGALLKPIGERDEFVDNSGNPWEFIEFYSKKPSNQEVVNRIRAWSIKDRHNMRLHYLPVYDVSIKELQRIGVWSLLDDTVQKEIEGMIVQEKVAIVEKMAKARKCRQVNPEWVNLPKSIKCTKCGKEQVISPPVLIKRAARKNIAPEEFHTIFVCLTCDPSARGRKTSEKYKTMTKELHCHFSGCSVCKIQHPSATEKAATVSNQTFQEYVDTWLCKTHKVKKAHHFSKEGRAERGETGKRGRPSNPLYISIPKEIACKGCGKVVKLVPQNILDKVKVLKITVEELMADYKCRSCGGRLKGIKRGKSKKT